MNFTKKHAVAGGLGATALALAAVFIPHWESGSKMDTTARHQSFDPPGVITVCDGITNLDADFKWLKAGMTFTEAECSKMFQTALAKYVAPIAKCIPSYYSMPPHRQVAVLSFAYNLGPGAVCGDKRHSGTISKNFNAGNVTAACNAMGQYVRANGKTLKGLENRRFDKKWGEISWCLRED